MSETILSSKSDLPPVADDSSRVARDFDPAEDAELAHEAPSQSARGQSKSLRNLMRKGPSRSPDPPKAEQPARMDEEIKLGDSVAARARRLKKRV